MSLKSESSSSRFQPGEGPSRGPLRDCTTSPINRFAALIYTGHVAGVPAGGDVLRQQDGEGVAAVQDQRLLRAPVVRGQGWPLAVIAADIDNLQQCSAVRREEPSSLRNHLFRMSLFPVQR